MIILALTLAGWLLIYFIINRLPVDPDRRWDFSTGFDEHTPYRPLFSLVYFSTYLFVIVPFFTLTDPNLFFLMLNSFIVISLFSCMMHAAVPSRVERVEDVPIGGISGWMLSTFQKTCKPHGNFPSMHVGLSVPVVATGFMAGGLRTGFVMLLWGMMIAVSTLYTKQHYIIDVLAGMAGGLTIFLLMLWFMPV